MHIFLTLNSLHEQKIISYENALSKGRDYIDHLFEIDALEPWEFEASNFEETSYNGLNYADGDSETAKNFIEYMKDKRKEKTLSKLKQESSILLGQLRNEPFQFCERIKQSSEKSDLYKTPILSELNIRDFWDAVMTLEPETQKSVFYSLKIRYKHQFYELNELIKERGFLEGVKREFDNRFPSLDPLDQVRLQARVNDTIVASIVIFDEYEKRIVTPPPQGPPAQP